MNMKTLGILAVSTLCGIALQPVAQAQDGTVTIDGPARHARGPAVNALRGRPDAPLAGRRAPRLERDPARLIERNDADGDGRVSRDEFVDEHLSRVDGHFTRLDADGNGLISVDEAERPARPHRPGRPHRLDRPDRPERPEIDREVLIACVRETIADYDPELDRGLEDIFEDVDTDGDGQLSLAEVSAALEERAHELFARFDTDGDGYLSESEVAEKFAADLNLRRVIQACIDEQLGA